MSGLVAPAVGPAPGRAATLGDRPRPRRHPADIGQGEEVEPARAKAQAMGVKEIYIDDLREEFARDFVFPMFRANTVYEGEYLLGTSIARPLIAKRLVEIANETGADAIAHGARVVIHDDVLATGGTVEAIGRLVEQLGGQVVGVNFVIELSFLNGREKLAGYELLSLIEY